MSLESEPVFGGTRLVYQEIYEKLIGAISLAMSQTRDWRLVYMGPKNNCTELIHAQHGQCCFHQSLTIYLCYIFTISLPANEEHLKQFPTDQFKNSKSVIQNITIHENVL